MILFHGAQPIREATAAPSTRPPEGAARFGACAASGVRTRSRPAASAALCFADLGAGATESAPVNGTAQKDVDEGAPGFRYQVFPSYDFAPIAADLKKQHA